MTKAQSRLLRLMADGHGLMWFGDNGPELSGHPFWPQKRTVKALLQHGLLKWGTHFNETQRQCGICPIEIAEGAATK